MPSGECSGDQPQLTERVRGGSGTELRKQLHCDAGPTKASDHVTRKLWSWSSLSELSRVGVRGLGLYTSTLIRPWVWAALGNGE